MYPVDILTDSHEDVREARLGTAWSEGGDARQVPATVLQVVLGTGAQIMKTTIIVPVAYIYCTSLTLEEPNQKKLDNWKKSNIYG